MRRKLGHHTCVCLINQSYFVVPLKVFEVEIKMSGTEKAGSGTTKTPADFLKSIRGRPVVVKLNSGVDYRGSSLYLPLLSENYLKCLWINGYIWVGWCIEYWCVNVWSIFACRSFFCLVEGKENLILLIGWERKLFMVIVGLTVVLQLVMVEFLKKFANTERLTWEQWGVCVAIGALSWTIGLLVKCMPVPQITPINTFLFSHL